MIKFERIYSGALDSGISEQIQYKPNKTTTKVVGLLISSNISVSLAFENGTELTVPQLNQFQAANIVPNKRFITLNHTFKGGDILGLVTQETTFSIHSLTRASVYLAIETTDYE